MASATDVKIFALKVSPAEPLRHNGRLLVALRFNGNVPKQLISAFKFLDSRQDEFATHFGAGKHWADKAYFIETIVNQRLS